MASSAAMALPKVMKPDWCQLPQPVLVSVLQHVPVAHRLISCALVSTSWAQAAAEATCNITFGQGDRPQRAGDSTALQQYLDRHGRHVACLACVLDQRDADVSAHEPSLARLPCPKLEDVVLDVAQLAAPFEQAGSMLGLLQGATGLTSLHLTVSSRWVEDVALGLSALPQLREFVLAFPQDAADAAANAVFPGAVFAKLPRLNNIAIRGDVGLDTLRHVSALAGLQTLAVRCYDGLVGYADEGSALLAGGAVSIVDTSSSSRSSEEDNEEEEEEAALELQPLYSLHIDTPGLLVGRGDSRSPCFLGLIALEKLTLDDCVLDPAVMQGMSSLQSLKLQGGVTVQGGVAGMSAVLSHISGMQGLTCLSLSRFDLREQPVAAFSAFTSSSKLKQLEVLDCRLPDRSWEHVFAVGRHLPSLTELQLRGATYSGDRLFSHEEFEHLAACCSKVESLKLQSMSYRHLSFKTLLQLRHLRDLLIGGVLEKDWSVGVLAQLSGLTALRLGFDSYLSPAGALQLTKLTGLQELRFVQYRYDKPLAIRNEALAGQPPDVWYHLLLYCSVDEDCQALLLDHESEVLQQLQLAGQDDRLLQGALQAARLRKQAAAAQQCLEAGVGQALKEFDSIRDWFDEQGS